MELNVLNSQWLDQFTVCLFCSTPSTEGDPEGSQEVALFLASLGVVPRSDTLSSFGDS